MEIFGFVLPLWAVFLAVIVGLVILWKFIKFAIKLLLIVVLFFVILIGLDFLNVFTEIQNMFFSSLL